MPFALALTIVLVALAGFQAALVLGAPWGRFAWGGQHRVLPTRLRVGSAISIIVYAVIVLLAWTKVGVVPAIPAIIGDVGMWIVFGYFCLGIVMNAISRSTSERNVMVPVTIVLTVLSLLIALGYGAMAMAI
ncbi:MULTISPECIES: hypothetical protein [unclassified Microbacterium]|uniref:hypothetical protein n=1 Tax=unclassified Microbacterium TaxID=2609290 RepID=UPI00214B8C00|nr:MULTISPECIES: hypothetical protein [unclassified Microbacterium]MCR2809396.1 hypothetical protein [Microbacterium sp. zg.B185]WIM20533.1 hypothetical protein QNO12_06995 [Microbacterium sp. zg-B185]